MGAANFATRARGATAREAFGKAVEDALYEHGHGGYTGTIAEVNSFQEVPVPAGLDPKVFAHTLMDEDRFDDKFGPCGCVKLEEGLYLFFGWASS